MKKATDQALLLAGTLAFLLGFGLAEVLRFSHPASATAWSAFAWISFTGTAVFHLRREITLNALMRFFHLSVVSLFILMLFYLHSGINRAGVFVDSVYTYVGLQWFFQRHNPITFVGQTYSYLQFPLGFFVHLPAQWLGFRFLGSLSTHFGAILQVALLLSFIAMILTRDSFGAQCVAVVLASAMFSNRALVQSYNIYIYSLPAFLYATILFITIDRASLPRASLYVAYLTMLSVLCFYSGIVFVLPAGLLWMLWQFKTHHPGEVLRENALLLAILAVGAMTIMIHPEFCFKRINDLTTAPESTIGLFAKIAAHLKYFMASEWKRLAVSWLKSFAGSWYFVNLPLLGGWLSPFMLTSIALGLLIGPGKKNRVLWFAVFLSFMGGWTLLSALMTDFSDYRFSVLLFTVLFCALYLPFTIHLRPRKWKWPLYAFCIVMGVYNYYDVSHLRDKRHAANDYSEHAQESLQQLSERLRIGQWPKDRRTNLYVVVEPFCPICALYQEELQRREQITVHWLKSDDFCKDPLGTIAGAADPGSPFYDVLENSGFCALPSALSAVAQGPGYLAIGDSLSLVRVPKQLIETRPHRAVAKDPTIEQLRQIVRNTDTLLCPAPWADRLKSVLKATLVVPPSDFYNPNHSIAFLQRHPVDYSLVTPAENKPLYIDHAVSIGDEILYKIDLHPVSGRPRRRLAWIQPKSDKNMQIQIRNGKRSRNIYIDAWHGEGDAEFVKRLIKWGYHPFVMRSAPGLDEKQLFGTGLLMISYKIGAPRFSPAEMMMIQRYIASGGSLMLSCPMWVWSDYDHGLLEDNPFHRIAKYYNLLMVKDYARGAMHPTSNAILNAVDLRNIEWGAFCRIISLDPGSFTLLEDEDGKSVAEAGQLGDSRLILVGHNFMTTSQAYEQDPHLRFFASSLLNWLLSDPTANGRNPQTK